VNKDKDISRRTNDGDDDHDEDKQKDANIENQDDCQDTAINNDTVEQPAIARNAGTLADPIDMSSPVRRPAHGEDGPSAKRGKLA
jgi:hypothetical protein